MNFFAPHVLRRAAHDADELECAEQLEGGRAQLSVIVENPDAIARARHSRVELLQLAGQQLVARRGELERTRPAPKRIQLTLTDFKGLVIRFIFSCRNRIANMSALFLLSKSCVLTSFIQVN